MQVIVAILFNSWLVWPSSCYLFCIKSLYHHPHPVSMVHIDSSIHSRSISRSITIIIKWYLLYFFLRFQFSFSSSCSVWIRSSCTTQHSISCVLHFDIEFLRDFYDWDLSVDFDSNCIHFLFEGTRNKKISLNF